MLLKEDTESALHQFSKLSNKIKISETQVHGNSKCTESPHNLKEHKNISNTNVAGMPAQRKNVVMRWQNHHHYHWVENERIQGRIEFQEVYLLCPDKMYLFCQETEQDLPSYSC